MKFRDRFRAMKEEATSRLDKAVANVPLPDIEGASLALELAQRAKSNLESCRCDYNERRYADAAEGMQQAVEKTSKAFGLLTGTAKPSQEEMREVGHKSFKAFLLHFGEYYPKMIALMQAQAEIPDSPIFDSPGMRGVGKALKTIFQKQLDELPPVDKVEAEILELKALKPEIMWKPTLMLDQSNKWVASSVADLKKRPLYSAGQKAVIGAGKGAVSHLGIFKKETLERTNLAGELGEAGQRLFSLAILTCWHLEPARYPSVGDYWNLSAYNESAPLIQALPQLLGHTEAAVGHTIGASGLALKIIRV
jgi:hypothetical protein